MTKQKEIPIGGIGIVNGVRVLVREYTYKDSCDNCCFSRAAGYKFPCQANKCFACNRKDRTNVYFVEVKK